MRRALLSLAFLVLLASHGLASPPEVEINGHTFYGNVLVDHGDLYVPLDVVGPLLMGSSFVMDTYEVTLQRVQFHFTPAGSSVPRRVQLGSCIKRGAAVHVPAWALLKEIGGSYARETDLVRLSYPPAAAQMPPSPTPAARPTAPGPPAPTPAENATSVALVEVHQYNQNALRLGGRIQRVEVYNPTSPDPSEAIARTDLAGIKIYVKNLGAADQAWVSMWPNGSAVGKPIFEKHVSGFGGQQLQEGWFFVRLPLSMETGWHVVRVDLNHATSLDYKFITF